MWGPSGFPRSCWEVRWKLAGVGSHLVTRRRKVCLRMEPTQRKQKRGHPNLRQHVIQTSMPCHPEPHAAWHRWVASWQQGPGQHLQQHLPSQKPTLFENLCLTFLCLFSSAMPPTHTFPIPSQGPRPDHSHTHTLSTYLQQHVCVLTGAVNALPEGGNFRHPGGLMGEILLSKLSQHATNTPARFTHLEVALTFIRGIFCQLDRSCVPLQPVAGFGKLDASSCRML